WIVMKCLEKDRNRRYETANGLAHDIERYLHDEPVQACPPSSWYRLWKFAQRNKGPVLAATVIVTLLVGGIIGTTIGLLQARAERDEKEKARQQVEANFQKARSAVDRMFTRAASDLAHVPKSEQVRRALLMDALEFYQGFLKERDADPSVRHEAART